MTPRTPFTCIDLFCGCGGFSLGMIRSGFSVLAAIDFNQEAIATCRLNLGKSVPHINHGSRRFVEDPRRQLYQHFLRFVEYFQPRTFLMENVMGIRSAAGGTYFSRVQHEARRLGHDAGHHGYRVHAQVEDAYRLGVPQKRKRQLFIGVRADVPGYFPAVFEPANRAIPGTNLGAALADLPRLKAGEGFHRREYDLGRRATAEQKDIQTRNYLHHVLEIGKAKELTNHVSRPHSDRDLRDFRLLKEGENSAKAMRAGIKFEFPYDKSTFKDRYTRQSRSAPCSTIVAHLSRDGLMFIHPTPD